MADISKFLKAIREAVYGEQVRSSIHDAIQAVNESAVGSALSAAQCANDAQDSAGKAAQYKTDAQLAASAASASKRQAEKSADAAMAAQEDAASSANAANASATDAAESKAASESSADAAGIKAGEASASATNAANSAATATQKAAAAEESATNAENSASNAAIKANAAESSESNADTYAKRAQSYAVGTGGARPNEATDNAKTYYEKSKEIYENFNASGDVLGIKGEAETEYRTGLVNMTAENIGALPTKGGAVTGPITTTSHIYGIDASTGKCVKDIDLDGFNMYFGKRVSDVADAEWRSYLEVMDATILLKTTDKIRLEVAKTSMILSNNSCCVAAKTLSLTGAGTATIAFDDYIEISTKDNMRIAAADEISIDTQRKGITLRAAQNIRLVPGSPEGGDIPDLSYQVKTGSIQGIKDANGNKPSISNFGDIRSEFYNGHKVLGTNGGTMDAGAEIAFYKKDGSNAEYRTIINPNGVVVNYYEVLEQSHSETKCKVENDAIKFLNNQGSYDNLDCIYTANEMYSNNALYTISVHGNTATGRGIRITAESLIPIWNNGYDMGNSNLRWRNIYAYNGTIQTSDRTKKTNITELSGDLVTNFIMGLQPSSYGMADGTSGRTHWGLIAQDIEALMVHLGMDSKDFAGFIKSPKITIRDTDENGNALEEPVKEVVDGEYDYSLRYDEFIAPIIKVIQLQHEEIENLKADRTRLEARLAKIEERLGI